MRLLKNLLLELFDPKNLYSMTGTKNIRNFSIIAHIDHGKSTLADRLIQFCGGLSEREMKSQVLDSMDIERERGITIKAQTVQLKYKAKDGEIYTLNIIDTPGHVDFSYEVNRSLSACEGSLLVVDASQGVEAQTLANLYQAVENDHVIIPVLNKIDLPAADPERVKGQIDDILGIDTSNVLVISAYSGIGIEASPVANASATVPESAPNATPLDILVCESPPIITHQSSTVKSFKTLWITSVMGW